MVLVGDKNVKMMQEVLQFPDLISKGMEKAKKLNIAEKKKDQIIHIGMGGSALVGSYLKAYFSEKLPINFDVIKSPSFLTPSNILYIVYSYSGETRETLMSLEKILSERENSEILLASSGGELKKIAERKRLTHIPLPKGLESRSHLPYGISIFSQILGKLFNIQSEVARDLEGAITAIREVKERVLTEESDIEKRITTIAKTLEASFPFVVSDPAISPVSTRFVNQLAENAKHLASSVVLPEGGHNLICPLNRSKIPISLLFLERNTIGEFTANFTKHFKEVLQERTQFSIQIEDEKFSLKTLLYPTFLVDLISVRIADEKNVSSHDITEIQSLKSKMK